MRAEFDGQLVLADAPSCEGTATVSGETAGLDGATLPWRIEGDLAGSGDKATMASAQIRFGADARALEAQGSVTVGFGSPLALEAHLTAKTLNFNSLLRREKEAFAPPGRLADAFNAIAARALGRDSPLGSFALEIDAQVRLSRRAAVGGPEIRAFRRAGRRHAACGRDRTSRPRTGETRRRAGARSGADLPRQGRGKSRGLRAARGLGRRSPARARRAAFEPTGGAAEWTHVRGGRRGDIARGLLRPRARSRCGGLAIQRRRDLPVSARARARPTLSRSRQRRARHRSGAEYRSRARLARRHGSRFQPQRQEAAHGALGFGLG